MSLLDTLRHIWLDIRPKFSFFGIGVVCTACVIPLVMTLLVVSNSGRPINPRAEPCAEVQSEGQPCNPGPPRIVLHEVRQPGSPAKAEYSMRDIPNGQYTDLIVVEPSYVLGECNLLMRFTDGGLGNLTRTPINEPLVHTGGAESKFVLVSPEQSRQIQEASKSDQGDGPGTQPFKLPDGVLWLKRSDFLEKAWW